MADPATTGVLKNGRRLAPPLARPPQAGDVESQSRPAQPARGVQSPGGLGETVTREGLYPYWQKLGRNVPPMVRRDAWAKYPVDPRQLDLPPAGGYRQITLHHTGDERTPQEVEALHRGHEPPLHAFERDAWSRVTSGRPAQHYENWGDVGYNFLIGADGTIYEGRALKFEGAHVANHNAGNIGIAFLGDYGKSPLSTAQIRSAGALVGQLSHIYGIGPDKVFTHAQWDSMRHSELQGPSRAGQIEAVRRVARKP